MSLINLISNVESLKYEDNYGITAEQIKAYKAGVDDALEQIHHDLPRPEILAFAEAMEAEMARHDAEKGDSWKDMDIKELDKLFADAYSEWWWARYHNKVDPDHLIDIANFAMMLQRRTKDDNI